jgi:excisionase family DNA binding protein
VTTPLDKMGSGLIDALADRIAERAAEIVLERLRPEIVHSRDHDDTRLIDVHAAAGKLSVAESAIYKLAGSGRLPSVKVGGRLRFRVADIEKLIEQGTRSDERVRELARVVQAGGGEVRQSRRPATSRRRPASPRPAQRADESSPRTAVETPLKVLTTDAPDAADARRSG